MSQNGQIHIKKSCSICCKILKYIWPFGDILHWRVKFGGKEWNLFWKTVPNERVFLSVPILQITELFERRCLGVFIVCLGQVVDLGVIRKSCHLKDSKSKYIDDLTEFFEEKNNDGDLLLRSSMVR